MNNRYLWRLVAVIGFLSLAGSILVARLIPVTGYELSIYAALPAITWIGLGLAVCATIGLCIGSNQTIAQYVGVVLAIALIFSFHVLPVVRGYYLYASSDTFGHLGWIQDLVAGYNIPMVLLYPGFHILVTEITLITGFVPSQAILYIIPVFVVLYCISIEVTSRQIAITRYYPGSGLIIGAMLAPVMTVQLPNLQATPISVAIFYMTFVLLALTLYQLKVNDMRLAVLLLISLPAVVLFHPLIAVAIGVFIVGTAIIRFAISSSVYTPTLSPTLRILVGPGAILGLMMYIQVFDNPIFRGTVIQILLQIQGGISATGGVASRTSGLNAIDVSLWEILLKIFVSKIALAIMAGGVVLQFFRSYLTNNNRSPSIELLLTYALALIPVGGLAGVVFAAGRINLVTRFLGIIFVLLSIFATVGVNTIRTERPPTQPLVIGLCIFLVLTSFAAGPMLFNSPYLYRDSPHVPKSEKAGYTTLFEYRTSEIPIGSTRSLVHRYRTAYYGQRAVRGKSGLQSNNEALAEMDNDRSMDYFFPYNFNGTFPSNNIENETYLVLPTSDRITDLRLYEGLRYTQRDYKRVIADKNSTHIYSNNGFEVYLISPSE